MRSHSILAAVLVAVATAGGSYTLATRPDGPIRSRLRRLLDAPWSAPDSWPDDKAVLSEPASRFPEDFGVFRVFVDPGHGAMNNTGNVSSLCEDEQHFTLELSKELAVYLRETGHFQVELSRPDEKLVAYPERVERANAWGAHAFVSLHSDVRGQAEPRSLDAGTCPSSKDAPGFSVLWSDEGSKELATRRRSLAREMASSMRRAGFLAYGGMEYWEMYESDPQEPGVFVDRHVVAKRIYVLRKPKMPSIIVETHNAWDPREAHRWSKGETRSVFFATVRAALVSFLSS